jgi:outer membrane protein assembly factor BamD
MPIDKCKMNSKRILGLVTAAIIALSGCSSSPEDEVIENRGAQDLYEQGKGALERGNFNGAIAALSALDSSFPFGPYSHQVQLDLIYAYYKTGDTDQALASIDRFIRLNPNHANNDYAIYMRGLTNMDADKNLFQKLARIDRSDRDPTKSRDAFEDFRRLLEKYPESRYINDAKKRMIHIKNRLARYEIAVARYYIKRKAFVAAANRGKYVLENFKDSTHTQEALEIMVESYEKLGLDDLKQNALQTLLLNYPDTSYSS